MHVFCIQKAVGLKYQYFYGQEWNVLHQFIDVLVEGPWKPHVRCDVGLWAVVDQISCVLFSNQVLRNKNEDHTASLSNLLHLIFS